MVNKKNPHVGGAFDDFLSEEGIQEETVAMAIKQVVARMLAEEMEKQHITKTAMAKQMKTSRSQLDRLLDPRKTGVSIETLTHAAEAVGRSLEVRLV
jgi:antitoxin HicB